MRKIPIFNGVSEEAQTLTHLINNLNLILSTLYMVVLRLCILFGDNCVYWVNIFHISVPYLNHVVRDVRLFFPPIFNPKMVYCQSH